MVFTMPVHLPSAESAFAECAYPEPACAASEPQLPRRAVLTGVICGLGLLVTAGCEAETGRSGPAAPDPIEPVLTAAIYLADRYAAAATAVPDLSGRLTPLQAVHRAHITALARELGLVASGVLPSGRPPDTTAGSRPAPGSSAPGSSTPGIPAGAAPLPTERAALLADLRGLERTGQAQAAAACLAGPGYRAALLGSIAAARAANSEVLT
jgi:hypothetical protein